MIKWIGPVFDKSGYAQANRDYIKALDLIGCDIQLQPMNELRQCDEMNETTLFLQNLTKKEIKYEYVIHHYVPENIHKIVEKDKINIAYNTWETTALPTHWVERMNSSVDLICVPSFFNKIYYESSGINVPVVVVEHCFDFNEFNFPVMNLLEKFNDAYKFISVFQWTERKNPQALLKAYFTSFTEKDNVILILKTYGSSTSEREINKIKQEIELIKNGLNLKHYPPIFLIGKSLSRPELISLYKECDCFVLPTRGEGFGLPFAEAAICGNHIIAPTFGAQVEFLNEEYTSFIDYFLTPVYGMSWIPNYNGHMKWAEPSVQEIEVAMKGAYYVKARQKNTNNVLSHLNYENVGSFFKNCIVKTQKRG